MSFPFALLFDDLFSQSGHELSHAFDPDGRQYDQDGYLKNWWTERTATEFNKRKDCLMAQYRNYTISDGKGGRVHLTPELTIGEDVADAGGLAQAHLAWKNSWKQQREEGKVNTNAKLPGLEYTQEQLFFIAYGLSWSRNIRDAEAIRRLRTVSCCRCYLCSSCRLIADSFESLLTLFLGSTLSNFFPRQWSCQQQCRLRRGFRMQERSGPNGKE